MFRIAHKISIKPVKSQEKKMFLTKHQILLYVKIKTPETRFVREYIKLRLAISKKSCGTESSCKTK